MMKMRSSRPWIRTVLFSLTLGACGTGSVSSGGSEEAAPGAESLGLVALGDDELRAIQLTTVPVEARSLSARLQVMGRVMADPYRQAIVAYPFTARISEIHARLGDWVDVGDELLVLQSGEVGEATAAYYRAVADHELAGATWEREKGLFENGAGAHKDLTFAESALRVAQAELEAAEKRLHLLGFGEDQVHALSETHRVNPTVALTAPIRGKVVSSNAILGGMVDEGTEILTILDPTRLWVEASVYEKDIARVHVGQLVDVVVAAYPQDVFEGSILWISDVLDPATRAITLRTEVPNREQKLKPGMFADLRIELTRNGRSLTVPSEAVLDDGGRPMVFVEVGPGRFERRLVALGATQNGFVEVVEGLKEGDQVVTQGGFQLKSKLHEAVLHGAHVH